MKSFVPLVLSLVLGFAMAQEPIENDKQLRRGLCSPSVSVGKSNYGRGEQIIVDLNICSASSEWMGVYPAGSSPSNTNALNWQYTCGGQSCNRAIGVGGFRYGLNSATTGSSSWPIPAGTYQVFYNSVFGSIGSATFTVGGGSAPAPAPAPAPGPAPAPAPGPTGSCSPFIQVDSSRWSAGQQITATVRTCGQGTEWLGIFPTGADVRSPAYNWQYVCGGQGCGRAMAAGTYRFGFDGNTRGAAGWPLGNGSYQIYFFSTSGVLRGGSFTVSGSSTSGTRSPTFRALWSPEAVMHPKVAEDVTVTDQKEE